ncbi:tryptophan 2,3-dioxygenase family protein [Nocardia sp. NBC_00416]
MLRSAQCRLHRFVGRTDSNSTGLIQKVGTDSPILERRPELPNHRLYQSNSCGLPTSVCRGDERRRHHLLETARERPVCRPAGTRPAVGRAVAFCRPPRCGRRLSGLGSRGAESAVGTDEGRSAYVEYLGLARILDAQRIRTQPAEHDEMLFIIFHQATELWFKLLLHELTATREAFRTDGPVLPALARAQQILLLLDNQWLVLDTLTPTAFHRIRPFLGPASGMFSEQYRALEFLLGKRHSGWQDIAPEYSAGPSLFDELIGYLHRRGHAVPESYLERDWRCGRETTPELLGVFQGIYAAGHHGVEYEICEQLSGIDAYLRLWRQRHLEIVRKHIADAPGTGGTSGAGYLSRTIDALYFPELVKPHDL